MKTEIDPLTLGQQLMKPEGELGRKVGTIMNTTNAGLYKLALSMIPLGGLTDLLEVGFGNGAFFPLYFERAPGLRLSGTDFSEVMCGEAAIRNLKEADAGRLDLRCEDSSCMSFASDTFDWAVSINTVYFWEAPQAHLDEIRRVLKPGGRLLLGYRPRSAMEHLPFAKECFRLFEPGEIQALLKSSGFSIEAEQAHDTERVSADGAIIRSRDICTVGRKTP